jgi:ATP-dependent DNA helicase PIF1
MRLSQIFPERGGQLFGGVNVVLIGNFFQLPPVGQKSLYHPSAVGLEDEELLGYTAYKAFTRSIFLGVVQRQIGDEQADFRQALEELRIAQVSVKSFELLSSRVASSLPPQDVEKFDSVLHIYSTKEKVRVHNHKRSTQLKAPIVLARVIHRGS